MMAHVYSTAVAILYGKLFNDNCLGSFKVSASVSEAATSPLGLVSDKILNVSVSA